MQALLSLGSGAGEFRYASCIPSGGGGGSPVGVLRVLIDCMRDGGGGGGTYNTPLFGRPGVLLLCTLSYLLTITLLRLQGRASFVSARWFVYLVAFHNGVLAFASLVMHIWALYSSLTTPLFSTVCKWGSAPAGDSTRSKFQLLYYIFLVSKIWEYVDTMILCVRGRPLLLLHVWHHSSVVWEVWSWLEDDFALGVWGMVFNSGVHVVMYSYYACAVLKVRFPLKRYITMVQIVQFITSFASLIPYYYYDRGTSGGCDGKTALWISGFCNASFLLLFIRFYIKTYKRSSIKSH